MDQGTVIVVRLVALFLAALATGGLMVNSVGLARAMGRFSSAAAYTELHQATNRTFEPFMPIVVLGATAGGSALAASSGLHFRLVGDLRGHLLCRRNRNQRCDQSADQQGHRRLVDPVTACQLEGHPRGMDPMAMAHSSYPAVGPRARLPSVVCTVT